MRQGVRKLVHVQPLTLLLYATALMVCYQEECTLALGAIRRKTNVFLSLLPLDTLTATILDDEGECRHLVRLHSSDSGGEVEYITASPSQEAMLQWFDAIAAACANLSARK